MYYIQTIQHVRRFVRTHPEHPISEAWEDMLFDMDGDIETTFKDFKDEAEQQANKGNLSSYDLEQLFE